MIGIYRNDPATDLLSLVKNPAVATPAFCDPRPMLSPASAAAPQGVAGFAGSGRVCRSAVSNVAIVSVARLALVGMKLTGISKIAPCTSTGGGWCAG
jgi:hypothetical protein